MEELQSPSRRWLTGRQSKNEELDLGAILKLLLRHQMLLFVLSISAVASAVFIHYIKPAYKVSATLQIAADEINPLQMVASRITGMAGGGGLLGSRAGDKYIKQLGSFEFYLKASTSLKESKELQLQKADFFSSHPALKHWYSILRKLEWLKPHPVEDQSLTDRKLATKISEWLSVAREGPDSIRLYITSPNADLSLFLVNHLADFAADFLIDGEMRELDAAEKYIRVQVEQAEKATKQATDEMIEFKKSKNLISLDAGSRDVSGRLFEIKREIEESKTQVENNQNLIRTFTMEFNKQSKEGSLKGSDLSSIGLQPKFGWVRRIQELQRENQYLEVRKKTLLQIYDDVSKQQDPYQDQQVFELRKRVELHSGMYQESKKQLFQIEMQRIILKNKVRPFEKAQDFAVKRSVSINKQIAFALLIALLIGGLSAYIWEVLVPTVKNRADFDEVNITFLGSIPDLSKRPHKTKHYHFLKPAAKGLPAIIKFDIDSSASMAFKYIRARIQHLVESKQADQIQIISILSAVHSEGKSFVASNLAACIGFMKKRTLLIDCDLRKATVSEVFQISRALGLTEVLKGTQQFANVVKIDVLPKLDLLPGGTFSHDITELLAGSKFSDLLTELRKHYDYIILDTPPLTAVPDSVLVSKRSDMMIVVASANKTTLEGLERAMESVSDFGAKNVYGLLNKVEGIHDYIYVVPSAARMPESKAA